MTTFSAVHIFCACLVLSFLVINATASSSSPSLRFDKFLKGNEEMDAKSSKEERSSSSTGNNKVSIRSPVNRPRRDPQYATYKVPKNHVLVDYNGWTPRQMNSFSNTNLLGLGNSQGPPPPQEYGYPANGGGGGVSEEDNVVAAGGHGHSQHGHGWGWGHGQGHQKYKYKKSEVNSSAVGMLGFLGLLALVQNVLRQMNGLGLGGGLGGGGAIGGGGGGAVGGGGGTGGTVGGKRKRRSIDFNPTQSTLYETTSAIVPYLLGLNQIREGEWPIHCASYQVCMLSKTASQGMMGRNEKQLIKKTLTSVVGEMLAPLTKPRSKEKTEVKHSIDWAADVGLKGEKCENKFKECVA